MITKPRIQKLRARKWLDCIGGGTRTTNTLDQLGEPIASEIIKQVALGADEDALLGNYRSNKEWCMLTTKRLTWFQDGKFYAYPWNEVAGAQQPPEQAAKVIRGELNEDQIADLEVFDKLDRKYLIRLEPGNAYYIIWSAILAFCDYSRRPDAIPIYRYK